MVPRMRTALVVVITALGCGAPRGGDPAGTAYGSWESPLRADTVAAENHDLSEPTLTADGIYWLETQADGHNALRLRRPDGTIEELLPGADVRTEIHSAEGGAYVIDGARILFTDARDQRLYLADGKTPPRAVTPAGKTWYAGCQLDTQRERAICIREDAGAGEMAVDAIVAVDLRSEAPPVVLVSGDDFYSAMRLSPDGSTLAWLSWPATRMPWHGTDLWTAPISTDGRVGAAVHVAGGPHEAIQQPEWAPDGDLYFTSERTGFLNLYRRHAGAIEPLWATEREIGAPTWAIDDRGYAFASPTEIVAAVTEAGQTAMVALDLGTRATRRLAPGYTTAHSIRAGSGRAAAILASPSEPLSLVEIDVATGAAKVLARSSSTTIADDLLSRSESITFPTTGGQAHAMFYPPRNPKARVPRRELPPLIVSVHGGPTSVWWMRMDPEVQFFTSRGFAVVKVNYRGSTGFGRAYREALDGQWGVMDVDDSIAAARSLVARGLVDGKRVVIRGGSAGGFTTLAALAFRDFFRAGSSYYGLSDLGRLYEEGAKSDKMESHYMDSLVAPYPARKDVYTARSPLFAADKISVPVLFLQGDEDPIVLPNQSKLMYEAAKRRKLPTALVTFAGEKHGFRKAAHRARSLDAEVYFYRRVLGIPTAGPPPIGIDNLP